MGSTVGCAECHDHKFDPFLAKDFYAMKSFFADIAETGLVPDRGPKAWGAQQELPAAEQSTQRMAVKAELAAAQQRLPEARTRAANEKDLLSRQAAPAVKWTFHRPLAASAANRAT